MNISKVSVFDPECDNHFLISSIDDFSEDEFVKLSKEWLKDSYASVFYNFIDSISASSCYSSVQSNQLVVLEIEKAPIEELKRISEAFPSYFNDYLSLIGNGSENRSDSIIFLFCLIDYIVDKQIVPFKTFLKNTGKYAIFEDESCHYDKHIRIK